MTHFIETREGLLEIDSPREPEPLPDNRVLVFDFAGRPAAVVEGHVASERAWLVIYEDREALTTAWDRAVQNLDGPPEEWLRPDGSIWPHGPGAQARNRQRAPQSVEEKHGARFAFTDVGNSRRFTEDHAGKLAYSHGPGWLRWNGKLWNPTDDNRVLADAKKSVDRITKEVEKIACPPGSECDCQSACLRWSRKSQAKERLKAMVELAAAGETSGDDLRVEITNLNADKAILNTPSGQVDLRTGERIDSDAKLYCTKITRAAYAEKPVMRPWLKFVRQLFPDKEMRTSIQRFCGAGASGEIGKAFGVLWGETDTAKTTFVEIIAKVLGGYAGTVSAGTLTTSYSDAAGYDLATLLGCRFARFSETARGRSLANERIKEWTGGAPIKARQIRGKPFEFDPEFTLVLTTNFRPVISAADSAMWNRLWSWELTHVIPEKDKDRLFADKMVKQHGSAVLKWVVEGAVEFYRDGLLRPEVMKEQLETWRSTDDVVGRWVEDYTKFAVGAKTRFPDAFLSFQRWCDSENEQGAARMTAQQFHGEIETRFGDFGFEKLGRVKGVNRWKNMLLEEAGPGVDVAG